MSGISAYRIKWVKQRLVDSFPLSCVPSGGSLSIKRLTESIRVVENINELL